MNTKMKLSILAFTDSRKPYQNFHSHSQMDIKFCTELEHFFSEALSNDFSGMLLEMKKVMEIPSRERNKIFTLAATKPLMRTRVSKNSAYYVDDPDQFYTDCTLKTKAQLRRHDRINVDLPVMISHEDDHVMAEEYKATIVNLSEKGCFIKTAIDLSGNHLVNIRINEIDNKLPICGGIRWSTTPKNGLYGYGIQFMDIKPDQSAQLLDDLIRPGIEKLLKV
ncbi:PilZ domain-containing protein [Maridesulfovibrio sp.]|uniref:PilZ domain-containing protein n=1 Tax=Maridesulfovibrio sp. TaxID=2795000 RepID=UPI0029F5106F|nr:PilZ domain-containing protein [Maridesulfovibrio sp.]